MMDALRTWLYGVFCAALLLTLTQGLLPKGKLRSLASLAGGLILLLALLRPLGVGRTGTGTPLPSRRRWRSGRRN